MQSGTAVAGVPGMAGFAVRTELEILDVRHFTARQIRPLLEQEARLWQQRLRWNYDDATELLLQYLDARILPGFVALDRGKICGFTFCVYEGYKAVIGDAFALDNHVLPARETTLELLRQLLQLLAHSPDINRIESQLLLHPTGTLHEPFAAAGFRAYRRLFMQVPIASLRAELPDLPPGYPPPGIPSTLELRRWEPADYQPAAEIIHASYVNHIDAQINDQYRSLNGSLRFLHNIVRFPGCGVFDAKSSWVLAERSTGALIGVLLASRVRYDTAHITQLCVLPAYRKRRLGCILLHHAMRELARNNFDTVTLTVTQANTPAVTLYEEANFTTAHTFDAHVYERTTTQTVDPATAALSAP
jgi:ribosomal protein S18 acetylase RimI-like enzyme